MLINSKLNVVVTLLLYLNVAFSIRKYGKEELKVLRDEVKQMFDHAYSGYIRFAYPYDELRPLTCDGIDTWGSYSLTLIDALDTLAVMGNFSEFRRVADIVTAKANFDANINVSVFETNIRIIGGLLSAHLLSHKAGMTLEPGWPCNGPLLRLAEDVAKRLLPAFDTKTGMPYGTVNLRHGIPPGETSVTCTAGVGTYIIEFGTLSRLTGDPVYEEVALNALRALFEHRSSIGLFGNHLDVETGRWTAQDSGIGAGVDSFFEYLVKGSILFGRPELRAMFEVARVPIEKFLNKNHWYIWASMTKGQVTLPVFQSLEAYWPGVLALIGDVENAVKTLSNYRGVWKQLGFTPEFYNIGQGEAGQGRESYPLRPELAESAMLLYRVTQDPAILDIGKDILASIQHSARTKCGYATIKDTRDHTQDNRMESFFLAETTKYLYLLFDPDNFIHNDGGYGTVHTLPSGRQCIINSGSYIFNTEAHPIDPGALQCCYDWELETNGGSLTSESFRGESLNFLHQSHPESIPSEIFDELPTDLPSALEHLTSESTLNETEMIKKKVASFNKLKTDLGSTLNAAEIMKRKVINLKKLNTVLSTHVGPEVMKKKVANLDKLNTDLKQLNEDLEKLLNVILEQKNKIQEINYSADSVNQKVLPKEEEPSFSKDKETTTPSPDTAWENYSHPGEVTEIQEEEEKSSEDSGQPEVTEVTSLSSYIQELVSMKPPRDDFDPQQLLEKIRANYRPIPSTSFELLTCPARSVFSRISIATHFYN